MKNARKSLLKAFLFQKEIYEQCFSNCVPRRFAGVTCCATSLFKVLYIITNFLRKARKCCHGKMVDKCYKSRVALHLQFTAKEVMTFFLFLCRSAPFRTTSHYFRKSLLIEVIAYRTPNNAINRNRFA